MISPAGPVRRTAASCQVEDAHWVSLSVLADIIAGGDLRRLDGLMQASSVLLKPIGNKITYLSCEDCGKGVYETKSCQCETTNTKVRYQARLRVEDNTYQINAVAFDAMEFLVKIFADGDSEKEHPMYYHDNEAHVEELSLATEAMPCTILATLEENKYQEKMEISLKVVAQTFHAEKTKVRHPFKPILRCAQGLGRTSFSPACAMADTSFEEGAGVTLVPGGVTQKFRALLTVLDKQATTERLDDASPAVRCSRKVCCALRKEADETTYMLSSVGPIDFATRLHAPRKGETLHAVVSWRGKKDLALLTFIIAADTPENAVPFKEFFVMETQLNKDFFASEAGLGLQLADGDTPSKKHQQVIDAARILATPESWVKRQRCE